MWGYTHPWHAQNFIKKRGTPEMFGDAWLITLNSSNWMFQLIKQQTTHLSLTKYAQMWRRNVLKSDVWRYASVGLSSQVWLGRLQPDRCAGDVRVLWDLHSTSDSHLQPSLPPSGASGYFGTHWGCFFRLLWCRWPRKVPKVNSERKETEIFSHQFSQTA